MKVKAIDIVKKIDHNGLTESEAKILIKAVERSSKLRRKQFEKNMTRAAKIVASWPEWKRNACLGALRPRRSPG